MSVRWWSWSVLTAALAISGCRTGVENHQAAVVVSCRGPVIGAWSEPVAGIVTRITAIDERFAVGAPLRVRLEIENVTADPVEFSAQQVACNEPFVVIGPDGRRVGWVGQTYQTGGGPRTVAAGKRVVIVGGLDLCDDYLLTVPGTYTITSRTHAGFPSWPYGAIPGIPASEPIVVALAAGEVPRSRRLLAQIHARLPDVAGEWGLHRRGSGAGAISEIYCRFTPPSGLKRATSTATLSFRAAAPESSEPEQIGDSRRAYVGRYAQVHAFLLTSERIREVWPDIECDVTAAVAAVR